MNGSAQAVRQATTVTSAVKAVTSMSIAGLGDGLVIKSVPKTSMAIAAQAAPSSHAMVGSGVRAAEASRP